MNRDNYLNSCKKCINKARQTKKETIEYDPTAIIIPDFPNYTINPNGIIWNIKTHKIIKGSTTAYGYKIIKLFNEKKSKHFSLHRLLATLFVKCDNKESLSKLVVDHQNRDQRDNSLGNLKWTTFSKNNLNKSKKRNCSCEFIGVSKNKNKWNARISINKKTKHIGNFDSKEEAARAYENEKRLILGNQVRINFEDEEMKIPIKQINNYTCQEYVYTSEMLNNLDNLKKHTLKKFPDYSIFENAVIKNNKTRNYITGTIESNYRCVSIKDKYGKRRKCRVHRLLGICFIENPNNKPIIDHIDGNSINNSLSNLRWVDRKENNVNTRKRKNATSIYKGVSWSKTTQKWQATISIDGKPKKLGLFDTQEEAAKVYAKKAKVQHGEFYRQT